MVVTGHIAELVALALLTLRVLALDLDLDRVWDVVSGPTQEAVIQDVASDAVEVDGADAVVVRCLGDVLAGAAVVARVRVAGAVGGILAFGPSE